MRRVCPNVTSLWWDLKRHFTNFTCQSQFSSHGERRSACENSRITSSAALEEQRKLTQSLNQETLCWWSFELHYGKCRTGSVLQLESSQKDRKSQNALEDSGINTASWWQSEVKLWCPAWGRVYPDTFVTPHPSRVKLCSERLERLSFILEDDADDTARAKSSIDGRWSRSLIRTLGLTLCEKEMDDKLLPTLSRGWGRGGVTVAY